MVIAGKTNSRDRHFAFDNPFTAASDDGMFNDASHVIAGIVARSSKQGRSQFTAVRSSAAVAEPRSVRSTSMNDIRRSNMPSSPANESDASKVVGIDTPNTSPPDDDAPPPSTEETEAAPRIDD